MGINAENRWACVAMAKMNLTPVLGPTASSSTSSSNIMALQGLHCWSLLSHDLSSAYTLSFHMPYNVFKPEGLQILIKSYICSGSFLKKLAADNLKEVHGAKGEASSILVLHLFIHSHIPPRAIQHIWMAYGPRQHAPNFSKTGISDLACICLLLAASTYRTTCSRGGHSTLDVLRMCLYPTV